MPRGGRWSPQGQSGATVARGLVKTMDDVALLFARTIGDTPRNRNRRRIYVRALAARKSSPGAANQFRRLTGGTRPRAAPVRGLGSDRLTRVEDSHGCLRHARTAVSRVAEVGDGWAPLPVTGLEHRASPESARSCRSILPCRAAVLDASRPVAIDPVSTSGGPAPGIGASSVAVRSPANSRRSFCLGVT